MRSTLSNDFLETAGRAALARRMHQARPLHYRCLHLQAIYLDTSHPSLRAPRTGGDVGAH